MPRLHIQIGSKHSDVNKSLRQGYYHFFFAITLLILWENWEGHRYPLAILEKICSIEHVQCCFRQPRFDGTINLLCSGQCTKTSFSVQFKVTLLYSLNAAGQVKKTESGAGVPGSLARLQDAFGCSCWFRADRMARSNWLMVILRPSIAESHSLWANDKIV